MKAIFKYIAVAVSAIVLYSCVDEHSDINPANRPTASDIQVDFEMTDSNNVVFNLLNEGCTPIWYFEDGTQSTINGFKKQFPIAGTYTVEIKMYNNNGICDGSITKELTFTETFVNFDKDIAKLTGGNAGIKVWQIAKDQKGHLACGDSPKNVTGWYSANAGDKEAYGLYDDQLIFEKDGTYTYNPGKDGLSYINKGTSVFGKKEVEDDYDVANEEIKGTWKFEYRGPTLYLVLSPHTILGYLASDAQWEAPEFVVDQISDKKITLRWDGEGISWQYILAPLSEEAQIENLWNNDLENIETFYNPGWENEISEQLVATQKGDVFNVTAPIATTDKWQAQVKLFSQIGSSADKNYDFIVVFTPNADHNNVTVKLTDTEDDESYLFAETVSIKAGIPNTVKFTGVKGIDANKLTLVFDFGWNPENFETEISDITFGEHVGAIEEDAKWVYNAEGDLTKDAEYQTSTYYSHTDNWIEMTTNVLTNNNGTWTYKLPDATDMQWQAQLAYISQIVTSANKKYDFHVKLTSTTDVNGVTIKVTDNKTDKITLVEKRVDLEAGVEYEFIANGVEGQDIPVETKINQDQSETTGAVKFVFDFGGNPANTEITLSEMILQESK
ncbi:MAG: hypothetical protein II937_05980 [Bacteroidales bacterium]|nr:hypothetical protein [Bacteroidales bacterium]